MKPRPDLVQKAIRAGIFGNIEWKPEAVPLMQSDPKMQGFTAAGVRKILREFVERGGELDVRTQHLELWKDDYPFWYRALIEIAGFGAVFLEIILVDDDENEPFVQIVSVHPQEK